MAICNVASSFARAASRNSGRTNFTGDFHLPFEILTNDKLEAARTGNWFVENNLVIARLDKLSRDEDVQAKATGAPTAAGTSSSATRHTSMSATFFGGEVKYTKRYQLGTAAVGARPGTSS